MQQQRLADQSHDHTFGQDQIRPGERRTIIVIVITAAMMLVEIAAGVLFGSMALLADGLHMGSHAAALGIAVFAYIYARRFARDARYTFGTGKVNFLAGFAGAILLAAFALLMAYESVHRLITPVTISFDQAILVAVLGLIVNVLCVVILGLPHQHHHANGEHHEHHHSHEHEHDYNLRSAYLHVLADALTSVTAIVALLAGKFLHWVWMDPAMGILGSVLVARWSIDLLRATSAVLLDRQAPQGLVDDIKSRLQSTPGVMLSDLHVWCIGPSIYAADIVLASDEPMPPDYYKSLLPHNSPIVHATVEVHPRHAQPASPAPVQIASETGT
jgi:cation diffusion facilitator family transporter